MVGRVGIVWDEAARPAAGSGGWRARKQRARHRVLAAAARDGGPLPQPPAHHCERPVLLRQHGARLAAPLSGHGASGLPGMAAGATCIRCRCARFGCGYTAGLVHAGLGRASPTACCQQPGALEGSQGACCAGRWHDARSAAAAVRAIPVYDRMITAGWIGAQQTGPGGPHEPSWPAGQLPAGATHQPPSLGAPRSKRGLLEHTEAVTPSGARA